MSKLCAEVSVSRRFWDGKGWPGGLGHVTVEVGTREQYSTFVGFTEPGLRSVFHVAPELQPAAAAAGHWIVVRGQLMLVLAFAYRMVAAALRWFDGALLLVASILAGRPGRPSGVACATAAAAAVDRGCGGPGVEEALL